MQPFTDQELLEMLNDLESDSVERKESFSDPDKIRKTICAFANDFPNHNKAGVLFIGARDNGTPNNLPISDDLILNIANIKTDGKILPLPSMTVEKKALKNSEMIVVTVMPSDSPPVKLDGRIWIRTGSRLALASEQDERILNEKRRFKNLPFDLYPIPTAKISDLSKLIFEEEYLRNAFAEDILEANGRTYEERLASCRMIVSPNDTTPTILGLLALGKSPQDFIPGACIQFLRINGSELTDSVIDEEKIGGNLVEMLRRMIEKFDAFNQISVNIDSQPTHSISKQYPSSAFHQIIYNAVLHRTYENTNAPIRITWYNDRIEIYSPGGPYGNVTQENFGKPGITDYRNPNIAEALKVFGFVQSFGRGIALTKKAMEQNGNPPPEFVTNQSTVLCILRGVL
jgi:ATP-dependent DNA helicase RecG